MDSYNNSSSLTIHSKLRQMRQQFFADLEKTKGKRLTRSATDRVPRNSVLCGEYSIDSGLSSPGSITTVSQDEDQSPRPISITRHMSMDHCRNSYIQKRNLTDYLQLEAQNVQRTVEALSSTRTMQRRRAESDHLSIPDRKLRAEQAIGGSTPLAPTESEWGAMFDEMMAKFKHQEISADVAHICDKSICETSNCPLVNNNTIIAGEENSNHRENSLPVTPTKTVDKENVLTSGKTKRKQGSKLQRCLTEKLHNNRIKSSGNSDSNTKSVMRSISFHRPDIATYNIPLTRLRRTDSDNDVWIEQKQQTKGQPNPSSNKTDSNKNNNLKRATTWRKFTKILSLSSKSKA